MKKYKLIKEYPGSPELGTQIEFTKDAWYAHFLPKLRDDDIDVTSIGCVEILQYKEFWKEIIEKCKCGVFDYCDKSKGCKRNLHVEKNEERYFKCLRPDDWSMTIKNNNGYLIFPGSFKANITGISILDHSKSNLHWQEVTKEEYEAQFLECEILSFESPSGKICVIHNNKYPCHPPNLACCHDKEYFINKNYKIHSVKRKSDGEIFKIGDKILSDNIISSIIRFEFVCNNRLRIKGGNFYLDIKSLVKYCKARQPLFTTEDGVEIFEGDEYYAVHKKGFGILRRCGSLIHPENWFTFSTEEEAKEYIWTNKECLSYENVVKIYQNTKHRYSFIESLQTYCKEKFDIK